MLTVETGESGVRMTGMNIALSDYTQGIYSSINKFGLNIFYSLTKYMHIQVIQITVKRIIYAPQ